MADATSTNGSNQQLASFLQNVKLPRDMEIGVRGDDGQINWMAPNKGAYPLSHIATYQVVVTTAARTYREADEAIRASLDNARYMRNDCGIMECLESRQRCTALLNWHIEPEDDKSQEQKDLAAEMTKIFSQIPRFTEYRRVLLEALWYGKHGIQHRYGWQQIAGKMRVLPTPMHHLDIGWLPINGDKIVFRFDDGNLPDGAFPGQMGIRVGMGTWGVGDLIKKRWKVELTERGMAYFLTEAESKLIAVHRHMIEDAAFEDVRSSGFINGVGIRSRIYWEWVQKQESLGFLMEYLERSAGGIELWHFPAGNEQAKSEVKTAATERLSNSRNVTLVPIPAGEEGSQYGVQIIEPGMAGIECLKELLEKYFGHRIKRYILGQTLTSEADATGLGSGVADAHIDTLMQIVKYDSTNLEETITQHTLRPMQGWNFPKSRHIRLKFKIDTEDDDMEAKLEAYSKAYSMGLGLRAKDVYDLIGAAMPGPTDEVLSNKQGGMPGMPGIGGMEGGNPSAGEPGGDTPRNGDGSSNDPNAGRDHSTENSHTTDAGSLAPDAADAQQVSTSDPASKSSRALYSKVAEWSELDEQKHPRDSAGKFAPKGSADQTGKAKVRLEVKKMGQRFYAMADLPGGKLVTRSHEDEAEARRLAQSEIEGLGHEIEGSNPSPVSAGHKVPINLANYGGNRWYATADLPGGGLVTRSHEHRDEAHRLASEDIKAAGHDPEQLITATENPESDSESLIAPEKGSKREFIPHPYADDPDDPHQVINVETAKLDEAWQKDTPAYIGNPGHPNEIEGRREKAKEFLTTGKPIEASMVRLHPGGRVSFADGRHRFVALRDAGDKTVGVTVPNDQVEEFKSRFGAGENPHRNWALRHINELEEDIGPLTTDQIDKRISRLTKSLESGGDDSDPNYIPRLHAQIDVLNDLRSSRLSKSPVKAIDEGPKEGDRNPDGLVFHDGRWHREDERINPHVELSRKLASRLKSGESIDAKSLFRAADEIHGGTRAEGKYGQSDAYDSLESAVNQSIDGRTDPKADLAEAQKQVDHLESLTNQLPTQTNRSGNKDSFQQFSTPPAYSYAVAWAAGIKRGDTVLEPSAGTGSLAVHAKNAGADVWLNELDDRRAEFLRHHFGTERVTTENGEQIAGILPKLNVPSPDVVIMNPPFSQTAGRMGDKKDLLGGARHVQEGLSILKPGGRLVSIVGGGMDTTAPRYREWFEDMDEQGYRLRANVLVNGDVYKKYGTHFDSRVLVFDKPKVGADPEVAEVVSGEVDSIGDLLTKLEGIRNERASLGTAESGDEPSGELVGSEDAQQEPHGLGDDANLGSGYRLSGNERKRGTPGRSERTQGGAGPSDSNDADIESRRDDRSEGVGDSVKSGDGGSVERNPSDPDAGRKRRGGGASPRRQSIAQSGIKFVANEKSPERLELEPATPVVTADGTDGGELKESLYEPWRPQGMRVKGSQPHPSPLVESAAMSGVTAPQLKYSPLLSPDVLDGGKTGTPKISEAQLENIAYAGQAHEQQLEAAEGEKPFRRGFFIGDGTGSAKGRQIAGIIADNFNQGRTKAVWLSKTSVLADDARRDLADIGMDPSRLFTFDEMKKPGGAPADGVLFLPYTMLRSAPKDKSKGTNLDQVKSWLGPDFDGVIAFDEAHLMGNAVAVKGKRGMKEPSLQALAGVELQKALPNARVVYSSATGATEVSNLGYADRLGIWGRGTAFPDKQDFIHKMSEGGVAAMEAVAQSLKATGSYASRSLSMDGVEHERMPIDLTSEQVDRYNKMADAWSVVLGNIDKAIEQSSGGPEARKNAMSQFCGAQQRFFNQVITAMQTPSVIKAMEQDLAEGRAPVVGIVNTMEAATKRAHAALEEGQTIEDMDVSPREILMQFLERSFPVHRYETYLDDDGNERSRPVTRQLKDESGKPIVDAAGKPVTELVEDPAAVARRDEMLDMVGAMRDVIPKSPLDMIIDHFGVDNVAEATGRTRRVVHRKGPSGELEAVLERREPAVANDVEAKAFQDGSKKVLIFSDAGGTGRSYHASRKAGNQGRRVHYMLQPGWRADSAMQALGRTHRTNQSSAPIYRLPAINQIRAQKRFISTIARRLDQLGAISRGQRQTGGGGIFSASDNLESREAQDALDSFFRQLGTGRIQGLNQDEVMAQMGFRRNSEGNYPTDIPVTQFLNRMLALKIDQQGKVFDAYEKTLTDTIHRAIEEGSLDTGLENYRAHRVSQKSDDVIYVDPASGAATRHIVANVEQPSGRVSFDEALAGKPAAFWKNKRSGQVWAAHEGMDEYDDRGRHIGHMMLLHGPAGTTQKKSPYDASGYSGAFEEVSADKARELWDKQFTQIPEFESSDQHFVTGALLPVWDKLPAHKPRVFRVKVGDKTIVGRHIPEEEVNDMLDRMGAAAGRVSHSIDDAYEKLMDQKHVVHLANGWQLKGRMVQGEKRIELRGPQYSHMNEIKKDGVYVDRLGGYDTTYFVPTGDEGKEVLRRITKNRPIAKITGKFDLDRYSRQQVDAPHAWQQELADAIAKRISGS